MPLVQSRPSFIRPLFQLFILLLLAVLASARLYGQDVKISLDPQTFEGDAQVTFDIYYSDETTPNIPTQTEQDQTDDGVYTIASDPGTLTPDPRQPAYHYRIYWRRNQPKDAPWHVTDIRVNSTGRFVDSLSKVRIKFGQAGQESVGHITIPVHSAANDDLIDISQNQLPLNVRLSDSNPPQLIFDNKLNDFSVHITGVKAFSRNCPQCWADTQSPSAAPIDLVIAPHNNLPIPINLKQHPIAAMWDTAFVLKKETPHDVLSLKVTYHADEGGGSKSHDFTVPIRFSPNIWELAIAVLLGGFLGVLVKGVLEKGPKLTTRLVAQQLLLAVVAEIIAVAAASFDCKLVILGFDLDPRQFIPALLLALVVTGGATVKTWASGIIGSGKPREPANAAAGGEGD
jgi:hypothetical protein